MNTGQGAGWLERARQADREGKRSTAGRARFGPVRRTAAVAVLVAALFGSMAGCGAGQTPAAVPEPGLPTIGSRLAVGGKHVCVLTESNQVECWGDNTLRQASLESAEPFVQIDAGDHATCGLTASGAVECTWRIDDAEFPPGRYERIWLEGETACGLERGGSIVCVGKNGSVAERVLRGVDALDISFGNQHGCATSSTELLCWTVDGLVERIPGVFRSVQVEPLHASACAFDGVDSHCWELGHWAQRRREAGYVISSPSGTCRIDPGQILSCSPGFHIGPTPRVRELELGVGFGCFIATNDQVSCFGRDLAQRGLDYRARRWVQTSGPCLRADSGEVRCLAGVPAPAVDFDSIAASWSGGCGERDGKLSCWGGLEGPDGAFEAYAVGDETACASDASGNLRCWGSKAPVVESAVMPGIEQISLGDEYVCALDRSGQIRCWGDGPTHPEVGALQSITVGNGLACGLDEAGEAHCWHDSGPTPVPTGRFRALSVDPYGSGWCGVRRDGELVCRLLSLGGTIYVSSRVPMFDVPDGLIDVSLTEGSLCWVAEGARGGCAFASHHTWLSFRLRPVSSGG